jgi:hypothetical protein
MDARIPIRFGTEPAAGEAVLVEGDAPVQAGRAVARVRLPAASAHSAGCACCVSRGPAAEALAHLFLARARGDVAWFGEVVAVMTTPEGEAAVRAALADDPVVSARYRLRS